MDVETSQLYIKPLFTFDNTSLRLSNTTNCFDFVSHFVSFVRLRHARLRGEMKDEMFGEIPLWSDRSAYKSLRCYELEEVPPHK